MIGLFSGKQIKDAANSGEMLTRSQSGKGAAKAITEKFGGIDDSLFYFYAGKGIWRSYTLDRDRQRNAKIAPDLKTWEERPNKFDWTGIDTKQAQGSFESESITKFVSPGALAMTRAGKALKAGVKKATPLKAGNVTTAKATKQKVEKPVKTAKPMVEKKPVKATEKPKVTPQPKKQTIKDIVAGMKPEAPKAVDFGQKYPVGTLVDAIRYDGNIGERFVVGKLKTQFRGTSSSTPSYPLEGLDGRSSKWATEKQLENPELYKIVSVATNKGIQVPALKQPKNAMAGRNNPQKGIKGKALQASAKAKTMKKEGDMPYFGQDLEKGDYKETQTNLKNNIQKILQKEFPDKLFIISYGARYRGVKVYWTGAPSMREVRSLGAGIDKSLHTWDIRNVEYEQVPEDKFRRIAKNCATVKGFASAKMLLPTRKIRPEDYQVKVEITKPIKELAGAMKKPAKPQARKGEPIKVLFKHTAVTKTGKPAARVYKGFAVTGDTYPLKSQIKAMGGVWNRDQQAWILPVNKEAAIKAFAEGKNLNIEPIESEDNIHQRITAADRLAIRREKADKKIERWEAKAEREAGVANSTGVQHGWKGVERSAKAYEASKEFDRKAGSMSKHMDYIESPTAIKGRIVKFEKGLKSVTKSLKEQQALLAYEKKKGDKYGIERTTQHVEALQHDFNRITEDIASLKALLPAEALQPSTGVNLKDLSGGKLKGKVGAKYVTMRYHNTNLSGGNFAIEVRMADGGAVELNGNHNPDNIITRLGIGGLYGGRGYPVITAENYATMKVEDVIAIIKKAFEKKE